MLSSCIARARSARRAKEQFPAPRAIQQPGPRGGTPTAGDREHAGRQRRKQHGRAAGSGAAGAGGRPGRAASGGILPARCSRPAAGPCCPRFEWQDALRAPRRCRTAGQCFWGAVNAVIRQRGRLLQAPGRRRCRPPLVGPLRPRRRSSPALRQLGTPELRCLAALDWLQAWRRRTLRRCGSGQRQYTPVARFGWGGAPIRLALGQTVQLRPAARLAA